MTTDDPNVGRNVRELLLARDTQVMISDAVLGMVSAGIELSARSGALSRAEADDHLLALEPYRGLDDISEACEPLYTLYSINDRNHSVQRGRMTKMIKESISRCKGSIQSKQEFQILKDFSFKYRELTPLFDMFREARNFYAHNTEVRNDLGWNSLILAGLLRVLERALFLEKQRIDNRQQVMSKARGYLNELFGQSISAQAISIDSDKGVETQATEQTELPQLASTPGIVAELLDEQKELRRCLVTITRDLRTVTDALASRDLPTVINSSERTGSLDPRNSNEEKPPQTENRFSRPDDLDTEKGHAEVDVELESDALLSVDSLYVKLQSTRENIRIKYEAHPDWRGPSSNLLQRAILQIVISKEPSSVMELLKVEDVAWRVGKNKKLFEEQVEFFGPEIDALLSRTLWNKRIL